MKYLSSHDFSSPPEVTFTVRDLMQALSMEQDNRSCWELGALVRDRYVSVFHCLPEKQLRVKKAGKGSHCFAVYPVSFWPVAFGVAHRFKSIEAMQIEMKFD